MTRAIYYSNLVSLHWEGANPSQDHGWWLRTITNTCHASKLLEAIYVAATTKSNKKNHSKSIPQVPLDANQ
jgi:hypothetical protein